MPPTWVPFALLAATFLGEVRTWRDYRARSAPSAQDRGSLQVNSVLGWLAIAGGVGSGLALRRGALAVPGWLAWAGAAASLAGTALRAWAVSTLGDCFSLTIQVRPGQPVIARGPYRILRHPSYAGGELALLGTGLAFGNWLSPALFFVPWLAAHLWRIHVEEQALREVLGEAYVAYCRRTWRLVPFIW